MYGSNWNEFLNDKSVIFATENPFIIKNMR